jgi:peroxiredoxin
MGDPLHPLQPGDAAPAFALPAANREGMVSLADLRGRPFLIGFFRGLHCPFCRRQVMQLAEMQPALQAAGVETLVVINTPVERARLYFSYRPLPVILLSDPDCRTHWAFGVPHVDFLPEGSSEPPEWPLRTTMADFEAARVNPTGELPQPLQPMAANAALNVKDGFEPNEADNAIIEKHGTQLVGHFLVDGAGTIAWVHIEARDGPNGLCLFPNAAEILAAAHHLGDDRALGAS